LLQPIARAIRGAADLPRTRMSDFIEERLKALLERNREQLASVCINSLMRLPFCIP
jgi:hypothetical protein